MDIDIVDFLGEFIVDSYEWGFFVVCDFCLLMIKSFWEGDDCYFDIYWLLWDGFWDYGDWVQKDEDGFWFFYGCVDDVFNVVGCKVGFVEVEGVFIEYDVVNQVVVVGVFDDIIGMVVVVYVVLEDGIDESDDFCEEFWGVVGDELGKLFCLWEILFVDEFLKMQLGKIICCVIVFIYVGEDFGDMSSIENFELFEKIENVF